MENSRIYKRNFIWNIIGSLSNALSSFVLLLIVNRILGDYQGGLFSIGFATAQLMAIIGCFEVRAFQSTDVTNKYDFRDYYVFRVITCSVMMAISLIFIIIKGYSGDKAVIVYLLCIYKMIDSLADVFEGLFQVKNRLDLTGKALSLRVVISTITLLFILIISNSLIISLIVVCLSAYLCYLFYAKRIARKMIVNKSESSFFRITKLFSECLPLFIASFLHMYIINAPKYCIDKFMSAQMQNNFTIIFMPAFVINLLCIFILRPSVVDIAKYYQNSEINKLKKLVYKICVYVLVVGIICIVGMRLIGVYILSWIYNVNLNVYNTEIVIIMIGGLFNAIATVFYYLLTSIRYQNSIVAIYLITSILTLLMSNILVNNYGLLGASILSTLSMFFIMVQSIFLSCKKIKIENDNVDIK